MLKHNNAIRIPVADNIHTFSKNSILSHISSKKSLRFWLFGQNTFIQKGLLHPSSYKAVNVVSL